MWRACLSYASTLSTDLISTSPSCNSTAMDSALHVRGLPIGLSGCEVQLASARTARWHTRRRGSTTTCCPTRADSSATSKYECNKALLLAPPMAMCPLFMVNTTSVVEDSRRTSPGPLASEQLHWVKIEQMQAPVGCFSTRRINDVVIERRWNVVCIRLVFDASRDAHKRTGLSKSCGKR
ncbi:hypothetical protein HDK64DRAFT_77361 [Phyllosticta capitalensis]